VKSLESFGFTRGIRFKWKFYAWGRRVVKLQVETGFWAGCYVVNLLKFSVVVDSLRYL